MKNQRSQLIFYLFFSIIFFAGAIFLFSSNRISFLNAKGQDFIVQWLAIRTFAKEGLSPYLPVVQATTEEFVYGDQANSVSARLKFSSPLYSVIIVLPFALISGVRTAQLFWIILLGLALMVNSAIALRLTSWKPAAWLLFILSAFTFFGYHNLQALNSGSLAILSALFVYLALLAIRSKRYELAGILLATSTIYPRAVFLVIVFILLWTISRRFSAVLFWFLAGIAFLSLLGILFIPDWPLQYLRVIYNFRDYYPVINPVAVLSRNLPGVGRQLGWGLSLLMVILLFFEWWVARKKDFPWFLWTVSLTLVAGAWIGIPADPDDFVFLILPLVVILAAWDRRFSHFGKWMAGITLVTLLAGLWGIYYVTYSVMSPLDQSRIFLFVLPLSLLIGLYWVRWWAIRPYRGLIEELKAVEIF